MIAKFQLTKEEYVRYFYYTNWIGPHRKKMRLSRYTAILIPVVLFLILVLFEFEFSTRSSQLSYLLPVCFLLFLAITMNNRMKATFRKQVELMEKENDPEILYGETEIQFSAEHIHVTNGIEDNQIRWKGIRRKVTDQNAWYLYLNSYRALIIPFRCFPSGEEKKAFEKLLSEHLPFLAEFPDQ